MHDKDMYLAKSQKGCSFINKQTNKQTNKQKQKQALKNGGETSQLAKSLRQALLFVFAKHLCTPVQRPPAKLLWKRSGAQEKK